MSDNEDIDERIAAARSKYEAGLAELNEKISALLARSAASKPVQVPVEKEPGPVDPRPDALLKANVAPERLGDARALFRAGGNVRTNEWHFGDQTGTVDELAEAFVKERPWLTADVEQDEEPAIDPRTHYPDGTELPPDQIDDFALAGPTPELKREEEPSEPVPGEDDLASDYRAAGPMPVQGLSDAGLDAWNDELDAHAKYREEANKERVEALKESGARIDEPVRELKWNK
jgi:hypothetical protein